MPKYSDSQLLAIIRKSARRVNRELCLFSTVDEIVVDASGCISPQDGTLEDLVLMGAECLLAQRGVSADLDSDSAGVRVVDGEQAIDTRGKADARNNFLNSPYGPCAEYRAQISIEKMKRFGKPGAGCGYDIW